MSNSTSITAHTRRGRIRRRSTSSAPRRRRPSRVVLDGTGWREEPRRALVELIRRGSGRGLPVALDFDNTIICGDIAEATLAVLTRNGDLSPARISRTLSPSFRTREGAQVALDDPPDVTAYYEAFLAASAHGSADPAPMANGYAWVIEVMEGLTPWDIVRATQEAFAGPDAMREGRIEVTPGRTAYPVPSFYPEMVELIRELRRHEFDVWIVSASSAWSVRWMVVRALNPLLEAQGVANGIPPDHVRAISTLLQDESGKLYKDSLLVREMPAYAALEEHALKSFQLTSRLQFPVPTYSGKIACIWEAIGRRPYLAAGDSPGDLPMLSFSEHRLWIERADKPAYQEMAATVMRQAGGPSWIIHAAGVSPGVR